MKTPEQVADEIIGRFPWHSNVIEGGCLVGQQVPVARAIAEAIAAERERCAEIAHNMARAHLCKRRTNKLDRHAADQLVECRDKIRGG